MNSSAPRTDRQTQRLQRSQLFVPGRLSRSGICLHTGNCCRRGRHVIVELKRYARKLEADELNAQGVRYARALASILQQQQRGEEAQRIEVVFVLGQAHGTRGAGPTQSPDEYYANAFGPSKGSYRLYDNLFYQARNQYQQYLDASAKARALDELLDTLTPALSDDDTDAPPSAAA